MGAICTVIEAELGRMPHHLGLSRSVMVCEETEAIEKGPPEISMAGSTDEQLCAQPTFSMMWAGRRLAKSPCQSA